MVHERLAQVAGFIALREYREGGGEGPVPEHLIQKHAAAMVAELEQNTPMENTTPDTTPNTRQMPGIGITNGQMPDGDEPRTARPVSELRSVRGLDGREHRVLNNTHKLADYQTPAPFDAATFGSALAAYATGKADQYRAELRAMGEGTNTLGGFLVPSAIGAQVIDLARSKARLLQAGAQTMMMEAESVSFAKVIGDATIYQAGESVSITPSDVTFGAVALHAKKLAGLVKVSRELVEDASNMGSLLTDLLTTSMANALDARVLLGADSFLGLTEDPNIGETAGIAGNLDYDKVLVGMNAVRLLNGEPASLIAHPNFFHELSILKEATTNAYMTPPAAWADLAKYDTTGITAGTALIGDFSKVWIGMRGDIQVEVSDVAGDSFAQHEIWFKITLRCDSVLTQNHMHRLAGISY